jgi:hypothetical protein
MITIARDDQFVDRQQYLAQPLGGDTFLLSISGLAFIDFTGQQGSDWHRDSVEMFVPLLKALEATRRTPMPGNALAFALQQWTVLVTPNAFTDLSTAIDFGVAVDTFDIDWSGGAPTFSVRVLFDIACRDVDTILHRIAYMLTLIGNVVEVEGVN